MTDGESRALMFVVFLLCAGAFLLGFIAGNGCGRSWEREAAVKTGAGRWTVNPATGASRFEYGCK